MTLDALGDPERAATALAGAFVGAGVGVAAAVFVPESSDPDPPFSSCCSVFAPAMPSAVSLLAF